MGKPTKPTTKQDEKTVSLGKLGTFIMQTFGAACERMPNIWDQPPMQSDGVDLSMSKRTDARYRSGPSRTWLKSKNPASEAARREREEEWR